MNSIERLRWETFVVRLRREKANDAWRGQIVHLPDGESSYFATLAQVETFIRRFADGIEKQPNTLMMEETDERSNENAKDMAGDPGLDTAGSDDGARRMWEEPRDG